MGASDRGMCVEHRGKLSVHNTEVSLVSVIRGLQPHQLPSCVSYQRLVSPKNEIPRCPGDLKNSS